MNKDKIVAELMCPFKICPIGDTKYLLYNPTYALLYKSYIIYEEIYHQNKFGDFKTDQQNIITLVKNQLCSFNVDTQINELRQKLDNTKLLLYRAKTRFTELKSYRKRLEQLTDQLTKLLSIRHSLDYLTLEDFAERYRLLYLIRNSLYDFNNNKIAPSDSLVNNILIYTQKHNVNYNQLRVICRTDPWIVHWTTHKRQVFNFTDQYVLSDEQQMALSISEMLDSIKQCPNPPSDEIIQDDDMLDGWKLNRIKENEEQMKEQKMNQKYGDKGGEVFIPVSSREEAEYVNSMNTGQGNLIKARREAAIRQGGQLRETQLPDQQERLRTLSNQKFMERRNG